MMLRLRVGGRRSIPLRSKWFGRLSLVVVDRVTRSLLLRLRNRRTVVAMLYRVC